MVSRKAERRWSFAPAWPRACFFALSDRNAGEGRAPWHPKVSRLALGGGGFFAVAGAAGFGLLSAAGFGAGTFFAGVSFGGAAFFFGGGTAGAARRGRGTGGESGEGDSGREGEQGLDVFHSKSKAWPGREISQKKSGRTEKTVPSTLAECTQRVAGEIRRVRLFPGGVAADGGRSWSWSDFFGFASAQGEAGGGNGEKEQGGRFHG